MTDVTDLAVASGPEVDSVRTFGHWYGGAEHASASGATMNSYNPLTGGVVVRIAAGTAEDVRLAAAAAQAAGPKWAALAPSERSKHLHAVAAAVRAAASSMVELEIAETGKPQSQAEMEISGVAEFLEYYAGIIRAVHGQTIDLGPEQHIYSIREPFGVIGVITPWNAPVFSGIRGIAPAIAAGNAVLVKPSEFTSTTTLALARIATEAGLPDGVLNVVTGEGPAVGSAIVQDRAVGKVSFTGSVETGRAVARLAAERLIPLVLELGGKSPNIVFADADLDSAAEGSLIGFTGNAGQVCAAGTRILVEASVHDDFVARLSALMNLPERFDDLGPIITPNQFEKVTGYLELGIEEGATLSGGGSVDDLISDGQRVAPAIFVGVDNSMRIAREEIFGPIASVIPFTDESEAIRIANDNPYGLVSAVWTRDLDRAFRVAAQLETGQVYVNQYGTLDVETPFGGMKDSGYGREKGVEALTEFTRVKSVMMKLNR